MVKMNVEYSGELRCKAKHGPSGSQLETDAPADNHGKAERFSPTDLLGTALAACAATTLSIKGMPKGWDFKGLKMEVNKEMSSEGPRRIARLPLEVWMPHALPQADRDEVEQIIKNCPVMKSLSSDIQIPVTIHWP